MRNVEIICKGVGTRGDSRPSDASVMKWENHTWGVRVQESRAEERGKSKAPRVFHGFQGIAV